MQAAPLFAAQAAREAAPQVVGRSPRAHAKARRRRDQSGKATPRASVAAQRADAAALAAICGLLEGPRPGVFCFNMACACA